MPPNELPGGSKIWQIDEKLSLCTVPSLKVAQQLIDRHPALFFFSSEYHVCYAPFASDFGPVNLGVVHAFCRRAHSYCTLPELATRQIIYYVPDKTVSITNAAFLLASYLVITQGCTPEKAWAPFREVPDIAAYCDVTEGYNDYKLTVLACLEGLTKAMSLGWYSPHTFDAEEYSRLNSSSLLDMSMISPKFCAFRGPRGSKVMEVLPGVFTCPPSEYEEPFKKHNVSTVVRLNEASTYERDDFVRAGFDHQELYFDDCTTPGQAIVAKFLKIAEGAPGVVAVHCRAGLGRTGTLIAIYMMKHHGFTASECIGWLRIARPGCVIGNQQQFLHWCESKYRAKNKVLLTGALRRASRSDKRTDMASAGPLQQRASSAEPEHRYQELNAKTPAELGKEIAQAQVRRDRVLADSANSRDSTPTRQRTGPSPNTPLEAEGLPSPPRFKTLKASQRSISHRKRGSLSLDRVLLPSGDVDSPSTSTSSTQKERRWRLPSISAGTVFRSLATKPKAPSPSRREG